MNLSLYTGGVKPYLEYGWVCAPNAAGQSIAANTITTLYFSNEIADTGNFGSLSAGTFPTGTASATSQITLAAGTYYYEASAPIVHSNGSYIAFILSLRKNVTATPEIVSSVSTVYVSAPSSPTLLKGQFTITTSTVFDLTVAASIWNGSIFNGVTSSYVTSFTLATAGADQRTTIKLWKLA